MKINILGGETYILKNGKTITAKKSYSILVWIALIIAIIFSYYITDVDFGKFISRFSRAGDILIELFSFEKTDFQDIKNVIMEPMLQTISMSFLGSFLGVLFALPVALFTSTNLNSSFFLWIVRFILNIIRTIPVILLALMLTYILGIGVFAGFMAIFIFTFTITVKMLYEYIETLNMGSYEAARASGLSKVAAIRYTIMPQLKAYYYSTALYSFEMNIRSAAILGYVGAGGIGLILNESLGLKRYTTAGMILIMLIIIVMIIESFSRYLRKRVV